MLHFRLNLFLLGLHTIFITSVFVWFCYTFWWVFYSCSVKDIWAFRLMFPTFHSFPRLGIAWVKALTFLDVLLFPMSVGLLAVDPDMPLHRSSYSITSSLFLVTRGLTSWCSCRADPLSTSLPLFGFIGQHSCCASPFHYSASSAHLFLFYLFYSHGPFAKSFGLPRPNYHILKSYYFFRLIGF